MSKTIFITGASTGIGRATAQLFQERGWNVVATMRSPDQAGDWVKMDHVLRLRLDVTESETIRDAVEKALAHFGAVDVLVNNAGYGTVGPFEASTSVQVERQFATNVTGLMNVTRALLPHFRSRREGVVINVASVGGQVAFPLYSLYHATKWAVEGFSEALHYELSPLGIRVKIIEPGPIKTDFYDRSQELMTRPGLNDYDKLVSKLMPAIQKAGATAPGPEVVARTIFKAATDGRNRLRYPVNATAVLLLRRLLPNGLFMGIVKRVIKT